MAELSYIAPRMAADALTRHLEEKEWASAKVLDVAAGTGKVGEELHKLGFRNIEALGEEYVC